MRVAIDGADVRRDLSTHAQLCGGLGGVGKEFLEPILSRRSFRTAADADAEGELGTGGVEGQGNRSGRHISKRGDGLDKSGTIGSGEVANVANVARGQEYEGHRHAGGQFASDDYLAQDQ